MNHPAFLGAVSAAFLITSIASPVMADDLESITVTPAQATINQPVTVEIVRSGLIGCSAQVEFGDGTDSGVVQLAGVTTQVTHAYTAVGTYEVSVDGAGLAALACNNGPLMDSVTIVAAGPLDGIVAGVSPERTIGPAPREVEAGKTDRSIRPLPPKAGVYEKGPLKELFDTRMLTASDPAVSVASCGNDGNVNFCNGVHSFGDECVAPFVAFYPFIEGPPSPDPAIFGAHANCPGAVGYDSGTDAYDIVLANGWFISSVATERSLSSSNETVNFSSVPTGQGVSTARVNVDWEVSPGDDARYWIRIEVKGPKDTLPF